MKPFSLIRSERSGPGPVRTGLSLLGFLLFFVFSLPAAPFEVEAELDRKTGNAPLLTVVFSLPPGHYLYADSLEFHPVTPETARLLPRGTLPVESIRDPFQNKTVDVLKRDFRAVHAVSKLPAGSPLEIQVTFQGCSPEVCFLPETRRFLLEPDTSAPPSSDVTHPEKPATGADPSPEHDRQTLFDRFSVKSRIVGYLSAEKFLERLDDAEREGASSGVSLIDLFRESAGWITLLLILGGGLALNLTPCVLPMIPVNLAIIGAGARAGTRLRGFLLGGVYALGISLAYGIVGVTVVLTGSTLGSLNASVSFNAGVAVVFAVLSLAMFDVISIDLTRFQPSADTQSRRGTYALALFMGAVSALLAGACVAPVVFAVLLFATELYARGNTPALLLPFVLGAGMGLPWPFAGAGLSFLPRPGRWMMIVKKLFGILILGFAFYYAHLAFTLSRVNPIDNAPGRVRESRKPLPEGWTANLRKGLETALDENRPVLIDFWASWCKNCLALDATTLRDPEVVRRLEPYVKIKFRAENPRAPETRAVLDRFEVLGLPTLLILEQE